MDDKTEDDVIVEEGGGGVGSQQNSLQSISRNDFLDTAHDGEEDESEKGDTEDPYVGWDEVYEQEV